MNFVAHSDRGQQTGRLRIANSNFYCVWNLEIFFIFLKILNNSISYESPSIMETNLYGHDRIRHLYSFGCDSKATCMYFLHFLNSMINFEFVYDNFINLDLC